MDKVKPWPVVDEHEKSKNDSADEAPPPYAAISVNTASYNDNRGLKIMNPLHSACKDGDDRRIDLLVRHYDINEANIDRQTPLSIAVKHNHPTIVKYLLDNNADVNAEDSWGPLHEATKQANFELIKLLLSYDANPNQRTSDGLTPFHLYFEAFPHDRGEVLELFLDHGADVALKSYQSQTALHLAVQYSDSCRILEKLLKGTSKVTNVNEASDLGWTALHWLLRSDLGEQQSDEARQIVVRYKLDVLMKYGADVNAVDDKGESPLYVAAKRGYFKIVEELLSLGADIDGNGGLPAIYAALESDNHGMVDLLTERGAKIEFDHLEHLFREKSNRETFVTKVVSYMLRANKRYAAGKILVEALSRGNREIAEYMLASDYAALNHEHENRLPLDYAIKLADDDEIVGSLIKRIAMMSSKNERVHEENLKMIRSDSRRSNEYEEYLSELSRMKNETICKKHRTTYYDVLMTLRYYNVSRVQECLACETTNVTLISMAYKKLFPNYGDQIEAAYLQQVQDLRENARRSSSESGAIIFLVVFLLFVLFYTVRS